MSEKEKQIIQKLKEAVPKLSQEKKEYLVGVADGITLMATRKEDDGIALNTAAEAARQ